VKIRLFALLLAALPGVAYLQTQVQGQVQPQRPPDIHPVTLSRLPANKKTESLKEFN
jgi:hypothetical protein